METVTQPNTHHGHNVKRLREMLGVKQEAVATELNMTQQSFSEIEQKAVIEDKMLEKIATVLKIPVEAIKNMTEESTVNYINTFNDKVDNSSVGTTYDSQFGCTFNPLDKVVELYERMLKEKDAIIEELKKK